MQPFADGVVLRMRELGHPLCVGLDPYLDRIPSCFQRGAMRPDDPQSAEAVKEFCCRTIDLIAADVAIIKPQASLFERLGWRGWRMLEEVIAYARQAGLFVLLDAKRGDIADTAQAYAEAYLGKEAACSVDALTINPYLGPDSIVPFFESAEQTGRGVVVLVRNSNPASSKYQSVETANGPFFGVVARSLASWHECLRAPATGWSALGVTVAATHAQDSEQIREILPHTLFLVLGYGAQGASARSAVRGFVQGPSGLEGGFVSTSRPILFPAGSQVGARAWEAGLRAALIRSISELGEAIR